MMLKLNEFFKELQQMLSGTRIKLGTQ